MCVQPASRNTHGFVNGSPPPIPRLDLEKKRKMKLPPRGGWWWWVPDAPLSLYEPCCLTVHFFPSSFLQTSPPLLPPQYLPLSFVPSTNTAPLLERTIPRPGTSSRSIVFIPFLSSLPPLSPGGGGCLLSARRRRHSRELIEPLHSTRRLTIEPFQSFQRPLEREYI